MSEIHRIKCGNVNCYIVKNGTGAILVDTGKKEFIDRVLEACRLHNVKLIVLTHAHFDHAENAARIMLYHDRAGMLESAGKISHTGSRTIYFGHGKPAPNRLWIKTAAL